MTRFVPDLLVTLDAVVDRIIPGDHDPGARALGTLHFILARLETEYANDANGVAEGLIQLDLDSGGKGHFAASDDAAKDRLLSAASARPWFKLLCELTAEGFYADPSNGGNANAASWAMIGFDERLPRRGSAS